MSRAYRLTEEHNQKRRERRRARKLKAKAATTDIPTKNSELTRIKQLANTYLTNIEFNKLPPREPRPRDKITKRTDPSRKGRGNRDRTRKRNP
jgi:hypothetical protein